MDNEEPSFNLPESNIASFCLVNFVKKCMEMQVDLHMMQHGG